MATGTLGNRRNRMARMRGNEALQYAPRENDHRDEKNEYQADPRERAEHTAAEFFRDLETRDQNLANEIRSISGLTRMEDKDAAVFRPEWKDRDTPVSDWERTAHFRNGHEPSWMREGDRDSARGIAESFRKATGDLDFDEARTASHNLTETLMAPVSEQARILQDAPGFVREGPGGALQRDPGLDAMMKPFQEDLEQRTAWIQGTIERGLVNRNDGQVQYGMEQARVLQEDFKNIGQGGGELNLLDPSLRAEYETRCEDRGRAMMENFHQFRERETEGVHEHGRPSAREMLAEIDRTEWERNSGSSPEGCLGNDLKKFGERNLPGDMKFMEEFMDREAASAGSQDRMNTTGWGGDQEMTIWDLRAGDGAERRETEHRGAAAEPEPSLTYREPLGQRAEQAGEAVNGAAHRDRAEERREERRDEHREGYSDDERPETRTLWDLRAERQEREALEPQERDPQEGWNQAQAQARDTVQLKTWNTNKNTNRKRTRPSGR